MARLNAEIPDTLYARMCAVIPWGLRSSVYRTVTSVVTDLVEAAGLEGIMILENLAESITDMPTPRLLELLAKIRQSRKTEKEVAPASRGADKRPTKAKAAKKDAIAALLGGMGEEQLAMLAETLKDDPAIQAMLAKESGEEVQFPTSPPNDDDDAEGVEPEADEMEEDGVEVDS